MTVPDDRRVAILYSLAVGDALGAGTEFESPASIARKHGRIQGYVQGVNPGLRPGDFTDDTQMTLCVLAAYAEACRSGGDLLEVTLRRFLEWLGARYERLGLRGWVRAVGQEWHGEGTDMGTREGI